MPSQPIKPDLTFDEWKGRIDDILSPFGFTTDELPDAPYWDTWNDEVGPAEAIEQFAQDWWDMPADLVEWILS